MRLLICLSMIGFLNNMCYSQEETKTDDSLMIVTLNSGDFRIGKILSDDGREILLMTEDLGKLFIRKENIKHIKRYDATSFEKVDGEYSGTGPFTTRYSFTTNSLPIKKGENYAVANLWGPEVHFALSDKFSLGLMASWIGSPMILAAKYSIPTSNEKLNFGVGTLMGTSGYLLSFRGFGGLHWGMVTIGDRFKNVTISAGYSYVGGVVQPYAQEPGIYPAVEMEWSPGNYDFDWNIPTSETSIITKAPVLSVAGIIKVGKTASLFFDSMIFFGTTSRPSSSSNNVYDPFSGQPMYTEVVANPTETSNSFAGFLMPGMRFQKSDNRAFQVSLAGGFFTRYDSYTETSSLIAFPAPMVNWFFKF